MIISGEGRLTLQWMQPVHMAGLVDLFRCCYSREEWSPEDFRAFEGSKRRRSTIKVLTNQQQVVLGAILYTLEDECCRIRRLAVWPDYRNLGLATYMLNSLCSPRSLLRKRTITASVAENNLPAIRLLVRTMGFAFDPLKPRKIGGTNADVVMYEFSFNRGGVPAAVTV